MAPSIAESLLVQGNNENDDVFAVGQYVELYPTVPSSLGGSIESGTRGIVREIEVFDDGRLYRVAFLANEQVTGEEAWLNEEDLILA